MQKKELAKRLFEQREKIFTHISSNEEYTLYHAVAAGDIRKVAEYAKHYKLPDASDNPKNGVLSKNPVQNTKYHFVICTAIIARLCVEYGMEREKVYTLSDLYINTIDTCTTSKSILSIQGDMLLDFATQMTELEKEDVYSIQISRAIDCIYRNLQKKITVNDIAEMLNINSSYLSSLFKEETGQCITQFIRQKKIYATSNMLKYSDYSYSEIAECYGFASQSDFIQCFKKETGYTPKEYRKKFFRS